MTDDHVAQAPGAAEPEVPRLPRGRGIRLSRPQLYRIAGTAILLIFVIAMQAPCSSSVSRFVTSFGAGSGSAAATLPRPGSIDVPAGSGSAGAADPALGDYERLRPGMTDDEVRQVIDRARIKAHGADPAREPSAR
ncbi:MAG TPA: hypothetical protein VGC42_14830 [Kofleriaceae bacterium]